MKNLSQTGEFASDKVVEIINGKNKLSARVLGPTRKESQIEISLTDAYKLGMKALPPIKVSGDLGNAPKLTVKNKNKKIQVKAIIAKRHLHCDPNTAKKLKLKNNQKIKIQTQGPRALIFDEIIVRVHPTYTLALHLDTDEANAAGLSNSGKRAWGKIIK